MNEEPSLEGLIRDLHSSSSEGRRKAAETLRLRGEPGGQLSAETLIEALMRDITPLRIAAAEILREWHEYVPVEPLFLALRDTDEQVRSAARWALAEAGEHVQAEELLPHLADPDAMVQQAILYALGARAPVESVLTALSSPEGGMREAATYLVGLLGDRVPIEPLVSMLHDEDVGIRKVAAKALANLNDRMPVGPLVESLDDADAEIRKGAAKALSTLGTSMPVEPLINALLDTEVAVRLEAIKALANSGERMPVEPLRALLDDADKQIRQAAAKALLRVGEPAAVAAIVDSLYADHEWARENALIRLVESTDGEKQQIARHLPLEELLRLLHDEWWPVGHMAAELIAALGEQAPVDDLMVLLHDPLPQARWAALYGLELLGKHIPLNERLPIEPLLAALQAEDVETRRGAAAVLEYFGPRVPVEKLLPLIEVENAQVARVVAKLGRQEGIDALVAGLRTLDNAWHAAAALAQLGNRAPAGALIAALSNSEWTVRQAVAEALYKTHPEVLSQLVPELLETLCYGHIVPLLEPLRQAIIINALWALRSPQPAIIEWFDRALDTPYWEVRTRAALGLGGMKQDIPEATIQKLRRLLDDSESASVRKAARIALEGLLSSLHPDGEKQAE